MNNGWTGGQYSIFRVILGISVCAWSVATILPLQSAVAESSREWWILSSLLVIVPVLSLLLAVGWQDRAAAFLLGVLAFAFYFSQRSIPNVPALLVGCILFLQVLLPLAPYGSLAARGRLDPGNSWSVPELAFEAGYGLLLFFQAFSPLRDLGCAALGPILFLPTVLVARGLLRISRAWSWCWSLLLVAWLARIVMGYRLDESLGLILLQTFTFDPAWIAPLSPLSPGGRGVGGEGAQLVAAFAPSPPTPLPRRGEGSDAEHIFYDGHCGLCHRAVRFVLAEDRAGNTFRFAPLDSDAFRAAVPEEERKNLPDSIVVRTADGRTLVQAQAILYIMQRLGGLWRIISTVAQVVPAGLLNIGYAGVARVRRRIFAAPAEACPILPKHLRGRFDF